MVIIYFIGGELVRSVVKSNVLESLSFAGTVTFLVLLLLSISIILSFGFGFVEYYKNRTLINKVRDELEMRYSPYWKEIDNRVSNIIRSQD